ncbi:hypothetical protein [Bradyrhizobium sp. HKCCYLS3013]|uniref:hypothetical protein n=1 Tax=Bradyrhizobium sp. HKCCYLS3013 TaxID=3420735 RepID=UPI003EC148C6
MANSRELARTRVKETTQDAKTLANFLAENETFADALSELLMSELDGTPDFERAMADAKGYLMSRNVELPADARVKFTKNSPFFAQVCINESCISITVKVQ